MSTIYGYCRISTAKQSIERQERNILAEYPTARIIKEIFTGTKVEGRKDFDRLLKIIKPDDTIVFDSYSRMSRNEVEAMDLYEKLFNDNITLVFLKEPHIDTEVYRTALQNQINIKLETGNIATDDLMNTIISALNKYTIDLAKEQIRIAFAQAEKEVKDLHKRTSEGLTTAKLNGKQVGLIKGTKLTTKKSIEAKEIILKHSKDFNGTLEDTEVIKLIGCSRNSYYKYKRDLKQ